MRRSRGARERAQRAADVADLITSGVADDLGWSAEELATLLGFPKPEEAKR